MNALYPIKFDPIIKEKIWGGQRLKTILGKDIESKSNVGESWEISSVENNLSIVSNGFLKGNSIEEIIEIYMGDLVGDVVYDVFGLEFPLLIKYIDANDYLSIQVHPDDVLAAERHNQRGKTEMWFVIDAEPDAELIVGFKKPLDKGSFVQGIASGTLRELLNFEKVYKGDCFFIPAGRIHATGPGILFAEIQQTSDLTYRIYDWDRLGEDGKMREMHTELAVDAINFDMPKNYKTPYKEVINDSVAMVSCPYFTTNILNINSKVERDYNWLDSFVIFMAIEGDTLISYNDQKESVLLKKGESVLIPAVLKQLFLTPVNLNAKLLEVYIDKL